MNKPPLVSIICLCYNQASFVKEALESVWVQTYPNIELIVVDDGSTDGSAEVIQEVLKSRPEVQFLALNENIGNCRAFNKGLKNSRGKYIIDLAADDILLPERVTEGVTALEQAGVEYAVNFTDAVYIDVKGVELRSHYKRDKDGVLLEKVPQHSVYADLLQRYFICTPSMMFRKEVMEELNGYDEALAYEDFDFWVRSSRNWKYCFTDRILVKKRIVPQSWSTLQYDNKNRQLESTLKVCYKAKELNKTKEENIALSHRLKYEMRQALRFRNFKVAAHMLALKKEVDPHYFEDFLYSFLIKNHISLPKR